MLSIEAQIFEKVQNERAGTLFFAEDFISLGTSKAIAKALERLVNKNQLKRVARGIYSLLPKHPVWGVLQPTSEEIAKAISRRDKTRIVPTGITALNLLGLSTQVPMNLVYLTDGSSRVIKIDAKRKIKLKKTSPKNLAAIGNVSSLAIQALKAIGKDNVTEQEVAIILKELAKENSAALHHDIKLAPEWIKAIMRKSLT